MKKTTVIVSLALALIVTVPLSTGCVSVNAKQYLGMPYYPPTIPASVAILRTPPVRSHEEIGEIILEPLTESSPQKLEDRFRQEAAKMGANAVLIDSDRTVRLWTMDVGPCYNRGMSSALQRVIHGVAVKYTP